MARRGRYCPFLMATYMYVAQGVQPLSETLNNLGTYTNCDDQCKWWDTELERCRFARPDGTLVTKTANYTLLVTDTAILANGTFTISVPAPTGLTGKKYHIKNIGTGTVTVDANAVGSSTIDEQNTQTLEQYEAITIISDDTEWWII